MEELKQRILKDGLAQIVGMGFLVEKGFAKGGQITVSLTML